MIVNNSYVLVPLQAILLSNLEPDASNSFLCQVCDMLAVIITIWIGIASIEHLRLSAILVLDLDSSESCNCALQYDLIDYRALSFNDLFLLRSREFK